MKARLNNVIAQALNPLLVEMGINPEMNAIDLQDTPDFSKGDFALNSALKLAKTLKQPPMKIAARFAEILTAQKEWFKEVVTAPPGFINLFLTDGAIRRMLCDMTADLAKSVTSPGPLQTVVVDYSSVNIAKQMHVGHLRSTIIGDVISRVLEARGEKVIRQNHLGDWGLPIAMVLWKTRPVLREIEQRQGNLEQELTLNRLEGLYREATQACQKEPEAAKECHQILVDLQNGDAELLSDWKKITRLSMAEVYRIYEFLGVTLKPEHERGESFYRDQLAGTVDSISHSGHLTESQGAKCVFLEQFKTKDGSPLPVIVQKSDGGFNYETFDLAGIRFRLEQLKAERLIYITDARQALHFAQVFEVAKVCGWANIPGKNITIEHVPFGSVLGEDNKPLKTRSGENVKLADLLQESVDRAYKVVNEKNPGLSEEQKRAVSRAIGIGAIKYADLSQNRNNDYVFAWDRMLALNGNTAPYLQYAHARICSIFRKSGLATSEFPPEPTIGHAAEKALVMKLIRFPEHVAAVERELRPHILCNFLFELATLFSAFYDQCPVLNADSDAESHKATTGPMVLRPENGPKNHMRLSRLRLCEMVRQVLEFGLNLLGIDAPREM